MVVKPIIEITPPGAGYALLDSGDGEKLERYGEWVLRRPDPQALWPKNLPEKIWRGADAFFARTDKNAKWSFRKKIPDRWPVEFADLKFWIKPSPFKHTGLFPEQLNNWLWFGGIIKKTAAKKREVKVLNLFGYTGGATLAAARAGAEVCHVDGSKSAIGWGRDNAEFSGLAGRPIRWILDDAADFVKREIKRGRKYDGIIMDPPAFGHGPKGEAWHIEKDFLNLLVLTRQVLSDKPLFFLVNGYASGYSALAYGNCLAFLQEKFGGEVTIGEMAIAEEKSHRLLPAGIFGRWQSTP